MVGSRAVQRRLRRALHDRRRDERGAFAVLFAVLVLLLMVLAAFTVDLGQAYVSKRQLQTASDAGALAAARVYVGQSQTCAQLITSATLKTQAQAAADKYAAANRSGSTGSPIQLGCNATGGLTVDYTTSGTTPKVFSGLATGSSTTITTERTAQATVGGGGAVGNLRPWGICSGAAKTTGSVVFVPTYESSTTSQDSATLCGSDKPPGSWWVAQCATGQGNGTGDTQLAVQNGCGSDTSYTSVPQQSTHNSSPTALFNWLTSQCPKKSAGPYCLPSDTGFNALNQTQTQWQGLVGQNFQMPVFCDKPDCSELAYTGSGNGVAFAIEQIATVQLCGFKINTPSTGWPVTGPCATNNPRNYTSSSITNGAGFFVVITALTGGPNNTSYQMPLLSSVSMTK